MTPFNPKNKLNPTYGDLLDPAMKITDPEDAKQYLLKYIEHIQQYLDMNPRNDEMTAEQIAKSNLGYYAGYYDHETRMRVENLFMCQHPIFGDASKGSPTAEEAFKLGKDMSGQP